MSKIKMMAKKPSAKLQLLDRFFELSDNCSNLTAEQKLAKIRTVCDHHEVGTDGQMFIIHAICGALGGNTFSH